jgi:hypothetical protein
MFIAAPTHNELYFQAALGVRSSGLPICNVLHSLQTRKAPKASSGSDLMEAWLHHACNTSWAATGELTHFEAIFYS